MKIIGVVEGIEPKNGVSQATGKPWTMYKVSVNGTSYGTFDPPPPFGKTVEFEAELKGKYWNMTSPWAIRTDAAPVSTAPVLPPPPKDVRVEMEKAKQQSIEKSHDENVRQASFEMAIKLTEMNIKPSDVKPLAYQIYDLIVNDGMWENLKKSDWKANEDEHKRTAGSDTDIPDFL